MPLPGSLFSCLTLVYLLAGINQLCHTYIGPKGGDNVAEVRLGDHESFEELLRRFSRKVQQAGILSEYRRREHFEKPSIARKKKAAAKRRKSGRSSSGFSKV
jgi:small subunit ribosomal protein S21